MSPALRVLVAIFALLSAALPARAASDAALERGTAIMDPSLLREFDHDRFGIGRMLRPERSADVPLSSGQLFALPSMVPLRKAIDAEFERYIARRKRALPGETIGIGDGFNFQLFDRAQLDTDDTRFVLAGIVARMDRTYVAPDDCGEIRLIYRLTRMKLTEPAGTLSRLPMTLNLVLRARAGVPADGNGNLVTCSEIARRWLALEGSSKSDRSRLPAEDDPLGLIDHQGIDRIETNLQIAHAPKTATRDFRTEYLLKVFRYNAAAQEFQEAVMENQIDRERLLVDKVLGRQFKDWLLDPHNLVEFDKGTVLIPEKFLARSAIAATPAGFDNSSLQPAFGLMMGEGANPLFSDSDVVTALKNATAGGISLQNIRSVGGFERRLNDVTCSGCHQTRGIGGFHFPGVDWLRPNPSNSTVVPASPHFFGDQPRRRDILMALRHGKPPDYSRGFASRPQLRGSTELAGTEYNDGWGAHCYAPGKSTDASFRAWTCAEGLACQVAGKTSRMGMCFIKGR